MLQVFVGSVADVLSTTVIHVADLQAAVTNLEVATGQPAPVAVAGESCLVLLDSAQSAAAHPQGLPSSPASLPTPSPNPAHDPLPPCRHHQ